MPLEFILGESKMDKNFNNIDKRIPSKESIIKAYIANKKNAENNTEINQPQLPEDFNSSCIEQEK